MAQTPISFTARQILSNALGDLGVIDLGAGEVISAAMAADGLFRLNQVVWALRLQEFTFPFVARQVFPITANQSTYTLGPGGEWDAQRPQQIHAAGLLLSPATASIAITGVSPTNGTFTVAGDQTGSFPSGSALIVTGSTGNNNSYQVVASVYSSSTTITVSPAPTDTTADGTIEVFGESASVTEIPIGVMTVDAYQSTRVKTLSNTQFTQLYYNPTYGNGLGTVWLWPTPSTAVNACVIYAPQAVDAFADLTTQYAFPPGYADLFEYSVAQRLIAPYGIANPEVKASVAQGLLTASTLVKRQNVRWNDLPTDTGAITGPGSLYNILTGNG